MNSIAIVMTLALAVLSQAEFSPEQQMIMDAFIGKCSEESDKQLDGDILVLYKYNGTYFPDDESSKKFVACTLMEIDALVDGEIQQENYINFLSEGHDFPSLAGITDICARVDGDTNVDKGYNFYKCVWAAKDFDL
ncbi:uncharacterized protein LOC131428427 [Malaya genurostris]|uniref:uncharacterized protein LOC131428427 n=1 Tax=Malaya genurostris TaxID=325434 RepID=UPI0026F3A21E|nr:uncharacterized protein LOC131428427 [Malaya genurostris]